VLRLARARMKLTSHVAHRTGCTAPSNLPSCRSSSSRSILQFWTNIARYSARQQSVKYVQCIHRTNTRSITCSGMRYAARIFEQHAWVCRPTSRFCTDVCQRRACKQIHTQLPSPNVYIINLLHLRPALVFKKKQRAQTQRRFYFNIAEVHAR
jgi:hypothetical protein